MTVEIRPADLDDPRLQALLAAHRADMIASSPACSVHTLDLDALRGAGMHVLAGWDDDKLVGCGAVRIAEIDGKVCGELESMRTDAAARGRGVGTRVLEALLANARDAGATRALLETGSQEFFAPARAFYARAGFTERGPFGEYGPDPYSVFMTRPL